MYLDNFSSDAVGHIHMKRQIADSQIDSSFKTNVRHFRRYTHNVSHVDGYSGGAVFSLVGQFDTFEMVLDGIILHGGKEYIYAVSVDFLIGALTDHRTRT